MPRRIGTIGDNRDYIILGSSYIPNMPLLQGGRGVLRIDSLDGA